MTNQIGAQPNPPDYRRIHRATAPRLRAPTPALNHATENANVVVNKVALTLNRAGSGPVNPILSGLGMTAEFSLGLQDRVRGVWLYQDRAALGDSLKGDLTPAAPGSWALEFVAGQGRTVAGDMADGAKRNFIRVQSAFGSFEREFWIKEYEADVVAVNGQNCLDTISLDPEEVDVPQVASGATWVQANIDFMVSWNDEFQKLHNAGNPYLDPGFLKAYGGAKFVSLFQTGSGEGNGTELEAVTQQPIEDLHTINLQNTGGVKHVTVRFRSKLNSLHYVDVPILLNVIPLPSCPECPECPGECEPDTPITFDITADEDIGGYFAGEFDLTSLADTGHFGPAEPGQYRTWRLLMTDIQGNPSYDINDGFLEVAGGFIEDDGTIRLNYHNGERMLFLVEFFEVALVTNTVMTVGLFTSFQDSVYSFALEVGCSQYPTQPDIFPLADFEGGGA